MRLSQPGSVTVSDVIVTFVTAAGSAAVSAPNAVRTLAANTIMPINTQSTADRNM
jgi:hypothetical protein